ncbi:hypothetical protein OSTOST_11164 [Ostertagia ostertagi]
MPLILTSSKPTVYRIRERSNTRPPVVREAIPSSTLMKCYQKRCSMAVITNRYLTSETCLWGSKPMVFLQGCARSEDADSTLRSTFPQQSSVSLHDLRTAGIKPPPGYIDERTDNDGNVVVMPSLQWSTTDHQMQRLSASGQARSEPKIDSDLWGHPSVAVALLDSQITANGGRLFTKKSANGVINRVHSMPAHYHVVNGYHRTKPGRSIRLWFRNQKGSSVIKSLGGTEKERRKDRRCILPIVRAHTRLDKGTLLSSVASSRKEQNPHLGRDPTLFSQLRLGRWPPKLLEGQPAFPPASATQFATHDYFIDEEGLSTERLRDFPMMHRLLRESNSLLSHQRRPSSCIDLTSEYVTHLPMPVLTGNFHVPLHRGDYFPDSAVHNYAPYMRTPNLMPATYAWRPPAPAAVMDLPPPPPYPAGRKAPMVM